MDAALPGAEDPPPQPADRLWDRPHPGEATYLIASPAASGQGFQQVDVDLRLITRVGLSDTAALQAAYGVADPDALVRATAGRLLATYFASRTLAGVLVEDRQTFTDAIRTAMQQDLDRLATGVEIVAVVVEAIHPPPAAADAWHNVESAEIRARVAIADETGAAAKTASGARSTAELATYDATATAAEICGEGDRRPHAVYRRPDRRHGRTRRLPARTLARTPADRAASGTTADPRSPSRRRRGADT